ncbi:MAG: hypothetical protein IPL32_16670 [Chloracidobacterium sp.]|nr:hypothetical protein [Chloracidobacterium sp.]
MLFRPSFCANCGEKIDRADWGIFTSRRFCQVCESEFKGQDLIPGFIVGVALLIGVFGFGGYLKSGSVASESQLVRQPKKLVDQPAATEQAPKLEKTTTAVGNTNFTVPSVSEIPNKAEASRTDARMQEPQRPQRMQAEPVEEVYFCGASTVKGTPCKHRVKGNVRCFQHVGMPSLLPSNNLRIK